MSSPTERVPLGADWDANAGDLRIQLALLLFRTCHRLRTSGGPRPVRLVAKLFTIVYLVVVEWTWGIEIPWSTRIGAGLRIFHGTGIVVNDQARIGRSVVLRQGVCLGSRSDGGPSPVLEDGVHVGAGAIILGGVVVGAGARIGAGAVVIADVPPGAVAVGNPARILEPRRVDGA